MNKRPQFSILLPTFNRAPILPLAIRSVLNQTFDNFGLIISNGGSTDGTTGVISEFLDDPRIRYFESAERLSMAENYELTLDKAEGEYIVFFSDDDALVPSMLERVKHTLDETRAKMIIFPFARYYHERNGEMGVEGNTLVYPRFTGDVKTVSSEDDIRRMSGRFFLSDQPDDAIATRPLIGNVVFHRSILETLKSKTSSVFATIPVDGYFITLVLAVIDEYHVLDTPLFVWSQWKHNASVSKGKDLRKHYEKLLDGRVLEKVPLKFALPVNCAANAILQANTDVGGVRDVPIDWKWYFVKMHEYLLYLGADGVDTTCERAELTAVLSRQPAEVQAYFSRLTSKGGFARKQAFKRTFPFAANLLRRAASLLTKRRQKEIVVPGESGSFSDVLESARYLDARLKHQ